MKGKKLEDMTDEELNAYIAYWNRWRFRSRILILCGLVLKVVVLIVILCIHR